MKKSQEISIQRIALKQEITELIENTFPAKLLQVSGSLIRKLTGQSSPLPWYINTIVLGILVMLPPVFFALSLQQPEQVIGKGLIWTLSNLLVIGAIAITYLTVRYLLITIRDHIVDNIEEKQDLENLQSFLSRIGDHRRVFSYALGVSILWSISANSLFSILMHQFVGPSFAFDVWVWGFGALGMGSYFIFWLMGFPDRMGNYHYKLYELNPSRSEVIIHISALFRRPFWVFVVYLALGTLAAGSFQIFVWVLFVIIIVFWIPLIVQYINGQIAINKIVATKKWQTLDKIQRQIQECQDKTGLISPENIEAINKLMDLHERVYNSGNLRLTLGSIADLLSQLFLPVLALLFSNLDAIAKLLK